jgi:predicted  nucleic acid-binding Zn-ribbon protein
MLGEKLKLAEKVLEDRNVLKTNVVVLEEAQTTLESVQAKDKILIKELEHQLAEFRSDLIKVKSDKNKVFQKSKVLQEELSIKSEEILRLKHENKSLQNNLKKTSKLIESEENKVIKLSKEAENIEGKVKKIVEELESFKREQKTIHEFRWSQCKIKFESKADLGHHIRAQH